MKNQDVFHEMLWRSAELNAPTHWKDDLMVHDRETVDSIGPHETWIWIVRGCGTQLYPAGHEHIKIALNAFADIRGVFRIRTGDGYFSGNVHEIPIGLLYSDEGVN